MTYPAYIRDKARELRTEKHLSIDEIAERLALPKTTIYHWVRDLPLGRPRRANPGQRNGNMAMRRRVSVGNSDPAVVVLCTQWIRRFARNPVSFSIQYHADQDLREITEFWGAQVRVAPEAIRLQRKSNSGQLAGRTWRSRYGILTVTAGDTLLRARLQGWIDCLREQWLDSPDSGRSAAW
jgi:hypothetical protein